eukprot:jgi/Bigna1/84289/fgenesh1_pg.128_\
MRAMRAFGAMKRKTQRLIRRRTRIGICTAAFAATATAGMASFTALWPAARISYAKGLSSGLNVEENLLKNPNCIRDVLLQDESKVGAVTKIIEEGQIENNTLNNSNGYNIDGDPLWSARILHTDANAIRDVHLAYLRAGASVITCASYQASISGLREHLSVSEKTAEGLIPRSVQIAKQARKEYLLETTRQKEEEDNIQQQQRQDESDHRQIWVAGSVGPYGACLHDGSEYTGSYIDSVSEDDLAKWHKKRIDLLVEAGADLLAIETIPSKVEATAICKLLQREHQDIPVWVTFSCKDGAHTARGERIEDAVAEVAKFSQVIGIGVNCCNPAYVCSLLSRARNTIAVRKNTSSTSKKNKKKETVIAILLLPPLHTRIASVRLLPVLVAYPNSGEDWDHETGWHGQSEAETKACTRRSVEWVSQGARLVGGCCRIGPKQIHGMSKVLTGNIR